MARALIVGCGCRGRLLGHGLLDRGWAVRGTSRREAGLVPIRSAGMEAALADPGHPGTVLELIGDVAVVHWLLGSADGAAEAIAAIHGGRLEHLLERLVDTPVRGFVYEAAGTVPPAILRRGAVVVRAAADRWQIPVAFVDSDPADHADWVESMLQAGADLTNRKG